MNSGPSSHSPAVTTVPVAPSPASASGHAPQANAPATAWEALLAYSENVRVRYQDNAQPPGEQPRRHTRPTNVGVVRLLDMPVASLFEDNIRRDGSKPFHLDGNSQTNNMRLKAGLTQVIGVDGRACSKCEKGHGLWKGCVVLPGQVRGADQVHCANCVYNGKHSLYKWDAEVAVQQGAGVPDQQPASQPAMSAPAPGSGMPAPHLPAPSPDTPLTVERVLEWFSSANLEDQTAVERGMSEIRRAQWAQLVHHDSDDDDDDDDTRPQAQHYNAQRREGARLHQEMAAAGVPYLRDNDIGDFGLDGNMSEPEGPQALSLSPEPQNSDDPMDLDDEVPHGDQGSPAAVSDNGPADNPYFGFTDVPGSEDEGWLAHEEDIRQVGRLTGRPSNADIDRHLIPARQPPGRPRRRRGVSNLRTAVYDQTRNSR